MTARVDVEGLAAVAALPWTTQEMIAPDGAFGLVRDANGRTVCGSGREPGHARSQLLVALVNSVPQLLAELTELRAAREREREETIRECVAYLRRAVDKHRATAKESPSIAATHGNELAAAVLDSWANGMEIDLPRLAAGPGESK